MTQAVEDTDYQGVLLEGAFVDGDKSKLDGIEASADVTDATNVTTALSTISIDALSDVDSDKSKTPADGDVLTFDGTDWNAEAPAGGGGGAGKPYGATYIIAASGGDYVNLGAYVADSPAAGDVLFIDGTVTETAAVTISTQVKIIGSKNVSEIIHTGYQLTFSGADTIIESIKFSRLANSTGYCYVYGARSRIYDCYFYSTASTNNQYLLQFQGSEGIISGCKFETTNAVGGEVIDFGSNYGVFENNYVYLNGTSSSTAALFRNQGVNASITNNTIRNRLSYMYGYGIEDISNNAKIIGNHIIYAYQGIRQTGGTAIISGNSIQSGSSSLNAIYSTGGRNMITNNYMTGTANPIYIGQLENIIVGNFIDGSGSGIGIEIISGKDKCIVTGNRISSVATGIKINDNTVDDTLITSNLIEASTTAINDSGTGTFYQTATDSDPLNNIV